MTTSMATVPSHHCSQPQPARRPTRPETEAVSVNLLELLAGTDARMNPGQVVPLTQHHMPATKTHHNHAEPMPKQPWCDVRIPRQLCHRRRRPACFLGQNLAPQKHCHHHALDSVQMVRRKLVRQQRKRPLPLPALEPPYRNHSLSKRKKLYRRAPIRGNLPPAPPSAAQGTRLPNSRPPIDLLCNKCFFVFENRRKTVIVNKLDPSHPAPGRLPEADWDLPT